MMGLVVQKYGGSSVRDAERVMNVARRVVKAYDEGNSIIVVVSAQGDTTDDLIAKAKANRAKDPFNASEQDARRREARAKIYLNLRIIDIAFVIACFPIFPPKPPNIFFISFIPFIIVRICSNCLTNRLT